MRQCVRYSRYRRSAILAALLYSSAASAQQPIPSPEEMWRIIQEQARQLEEQRREIEALKQSQGRTPVLPQTAVAPPMLPLQTSPQPPPVQVAMPAPSPADIPARPADDAERGWWERTSVGGYGELHYEGRLFADHMQQNHAAVRRVTVLEQVDGLPRAEQRGVFFNRNRERGLGERGPNMGGHIIGTFRRVAIIRLTRSKTIESIEKIPEHIRIGILLNQERCRCVRDEKREQTRCDAGFRNELSYIASHVGEAWTARRNG